jgi:hypothetical protein
MNHVADRWPGSLGCGHASVAGRNLTGLFRRGLVVRHPTIVLPLPAATARGTASARLFDYVRESLRRFPAEQVAGNRVAVASDHVGPILSVLMRAGECPSVTSASATTSTKPVGPQT